MLWQWSAMGTTLLGTVRVPVRLRKLFLYAPTIYYWVFIILSFGGTMTGAVYGSIMGDHLIATGQLDRGDERGYFTLVVAGFAAPAFVFLIVARLLIRSRAQEMADLAATRLNLSSEVRTLLQKRFLQPWSMSFEGRVSKIYLRARLGARNSRDRIEDLRSREGWVISVPRDLSTLTVERVPPGYEMIGDYQYSGGSYRRRNELKKIEEARYGRFGTYN